MLRFTCYSCHAISHASTLLLPFSHSKSSRPQDTPKFTRTRHPSQSIYHPCDHIVLPSSSLLSPHRVGAISITTIFIHRVCMLYIICICILLYILYVYIPILMSVCMCVCYVCIHIMSIYIIYIHENVYVCAMCV